MVGGNGAFGSSFSAPQNSQGFARQPAGVYSGGENVLNNDNNKKKKWPLFVIGAFVVLLVIMVALYIIIPKETSRDSVREQYNILTNYVLYGEEKNDTIDFSIINTDEIGYAVTSNLQHDEARSSIAAGDSESNDEEELENKEYYKRLYELKNSFLATYDGFNHGDDEEDLLKNIGDIVDFLYDRINIEDPSRENLVGLYGKDGDYIDGYVEGYYAIFNNSGNKYSQEYGYLKTEILRIEAGVFSRYDFGACLPKSNDSNMDKCASVIVAMPDGEMNEMQKSSAYTEDAQKIITRDSMMLTHYIIEMYKILSGAEVEE